MSKSRIDGTSDYEKLKQELYEYKTNKKISSEAIIEYITNLEKRANSEKDYKLEKENYILNKRIKKAIKFIDNALIPMYLKDVNKLKDILLGEDI